MTTFQSQQCPLPQQQHDREHDFFSLTLTQGLLATIAKNPGHTKDECRKLKRKEEQKCNDGQNTKKEYPNCPTCEKSNHPAELCWKGVVAHLKPKNLRLEDSKTDEASTRHNDADN